METLLLHESVKQDMGPQETDGFHEAPGFAESIAQTILGEESVVDLSPFRLSRFDEGSLLTGISSETYVDSGRS